MPTKNNSFWNKSTDSRSQNQLISEDRNNSQFLKQYYVLCRVLQAKMRTSTHASTARVQMVSVKADAIFLLFFVLKPSQLLQCR